MKNIPVEYSRDPSGCMEVQLLCDGCSYDDGCSIGPHATDGILVWVNNESGWVPTRRNGARWCLVSNSVSINDEAYSLYFYPTCDVCEEGNPEEEVGPSGNLSLLFTLSQQAREEWLSAEVYQKPFKLYVASYRSYWREERRDGRIYWVRCSGWDNTPWGCDGGAWGVVLQIASVPISGSVQGSADAAVDNRLICPHPERGYEYPNFGSYTYLGGLFAGQVPWYYGQRGEQRAPDLSGTGRTLLRFRKPDGLPEFSSACVVLFYHATPRAVAEGTNPSHALGLYRPPQGSQNFEEGTLTWRVFEGVAGYKPGELADKKVGGTAEFAELDECLRNSDYAENYEAGGKLRMRAEQERPPLTPVTVPMRLSRWEPQGDTLTLLLALQDETDTPRGDSPCWYYFRSKEYGSDSHYFPRLWIVWGGSGR
ncbi:MAG: hypothetical protein ABIN58_01905 [candidate division WOR-3 bacterium]